MKNQGRWLIVTGISGSGRTTSLRALEDLGWFCVDNLPAKLLPALHETQRSRDDRRPVAVGIDIRAGGLVRDLDDSITSLSQRGLQVGLLFLDCADEVLVRRFAETRRKHPVLSEHTILDAIARERELMMQVRERTALVVDTSELNVHQLKARMAELFDDDANRAGDRMVVALTSFGFKHGIPRDADYIFDARGLANPYFIEGMRDRTGLDPEVATFVLQGAGGAALLERIVALLDLALPLHRAEGRALVTIGIGCTGGRHRSVALIEALAADLVEKAQGRVFVTHRDRERRGVTQ